MYIFFATIITAYVALIGSIYVFQRKLMYHPVKDVGSPEFYALNDFSEQMITSPDGERLQLWYRAADEHMPTIVYYHGNAFTLGERADILSSLASRGFGVVAVSYRGYGKSTGSPFEAGIYMDARAALKFATDTHQIPLSQIILFGESLGTGVSVQMATEHDIAGVVLQSAYTSVAARAAEIYFYAPVNLLIKDHYFTIRKIASVKAPLLFFHGEKDDVIPVAHGRQVFAAATSDKQAIYFPDNHHNDFDSTVISEHVLSFSKKLNLIKH